MTRKDLIAKIAEQAGISQTDADHALSAFQDIACQVVVDGNEKLAIPGFLTFEQGVRSARDGRNPQTGERIHIAATKTAKVTVGSKLKAAAAG
jgi:DNA-binding protein HU-beta